MKVFIILFLIYCALSVYCIGNMLSSSYIKTKIFHELENCNTGEYNDNFLTEKNVGTGLMCGLWCSLVENCRRFLFDDTKKMCSLFESGENCFIHESIDNKICYRQKFICNETRCVRCPIGYYGDRCQHIIQDCTDGYERLIAPRKPMMAYIQPSPTGSVLEVKCDFLKYGNTLIVHRDRRCKGYDFNKAWDEYVSGFGYKHSEYWLGLANIYSILQNHDSFQLGFRLDADATLYQAAYQNFNIQNVSNNYKISLGPFSTDPANPIGNAITGSANINGRPFSTYDRDQTNYNCPIMFQGGWWFVNDLVCSQANVIGKRFGTNFEESWHWLGDNGSRPDYDEIQLRLLRKF